MGKIDFTAMIVLLNSIVGIILALKLFDTASNADERRTNIFLVMAIANNFCKSWIIGICIFLVEINLLISICKDRKNRSKNDNQAEDEREHL